MTGSFIKKLLTNRLPLQFNNMALTKEEFTTLRKKGLSVDRILEYERGIRPPTKTDISGNQFDREAATFMGKARNFATQIIGGGKVAEGAGLAIAAPKIQRQLTEAEQRMSDTDLELIKRIQQKAAAGEDTTRLENARAQLLEDMKGSRDVQRDFVNTLPSNKEVLGSAARLAGTMAGGAIASKAASLTGADKAATFLSGATRGAAAGAGAGAVEGAIQGAGLAAEADRPTEELLYGGLLGAVGGAVTGGVIGGVLGSVTGAVRGSKIKKAEFAQDLVSPKMSVKDRAEAIRQGRLQDPTFFGKAEIQYSKRDQQLAESVQDVVSRKATVGENVDAIRNKISVTNTGVKSYIEDNKVPFNTNQLRSKLESGKDDLSLIFASDKSAERTYDAVAEAFMDNVSKKDTAGLFEARQSFDQIPAIKKLLESDRLGENARKEIVLAVRGAANDYISTQLPKGNPYKQTLLTEHHMLEALGNLADKSATIVGKNKLQMLTQEYPILKAVAGGLAAALGLGAVGVGGSVISSSE